MKKKRPELIIAVSVIVILGAYGIGLIIRNIRFITAQKTPHTQVANVARETDVEVNEPRPVASPEIEYLVEQEPLEEFIEEPVEIPEDQWDIESEDQWTQDDILYEEDFQDRQFGPNMQWDGARQWFDWANSLTEEQRARLERATMLMWQRWQDMSFEEAEAERYRMMEMGQRWWNMTDTERQQAMQRMQQQFQQWLESDQEELPEFTLD